MKNLKLNKYSIEFNFLLFINKNKIIFEFIFVCGIYLLFSIGTVSSAQEIFEEKEEKPVSSNSSFWHKNKSMILSIFTLAICGVLVYKLTNNFYFNNTFIDMDHLFEEKKIFMEKHTIRANPLVSEFLIRDEAMKKQVAQLYSYHQKAVDAAVRLDTGKNNTPYEKYKMTKTLINYTDEVEEYLTYIKKSWNIDFSEEKKT